MLAATMDSTGKFYLGHLGKVPVYAAFEALFLIFFIMYIGNGLEFDKLLILTVVILLTILLHELGHALVALAQGMQGVSITISALGGYCSYSGDRHPHRELMISLSGPATNLSLAGLGWLAWTYGGITDESISFFVSQFFYWNLVLGILNLLPIYPLDGGQAVLSGGRLLTRDHTARRFTLGLSFIAAFTALGVLIALGNGNLPMFTIVMAMFLLFAAYRDLR